MDLYESGVVRSIDLDGLEPVWGMFRTLLELLNRIALRRGIGEILSLGVKEQRHLPGEKRPNLSRCISGPGKWPAGMFRPITVSLLVYGTANRGASHQEGSLSQKEQHRRTFLDALCVCRFVTAGPASPYRGADTSFTGWQSDDASMLATDERIWNLESSLTRGKVSVALTITCPRE